MFDFLNISYRFDINLRYGLKVGLWNGLGIFLFILFFQPFDIQKPDFNTYILLIAGFGGITFVLLGIVQQILHWIFDRVFKLVEWNLMNLLVLQFLIWILHAVSFTFYLHYVGRVPLSIFLVFKVALLSLFPPALNVLISEIQHLRSQVIELFQKNKKLIEFNNGLKDAEHHNVELISENRSEKLKLELNTLIMVKSAENYVEIIFRENDAIQRKLLRATLKNIEDQLSNFSSMVRCHRTCIINTFHVRKLHRTHKGYHLIMTDSSEFIPVSRQHLLGVKSALNLA